MSVSIEHVTERLMQVSALCGVGAAAARRTPGTGGDPFVYQHELKTTFDVIRSLVEVAICNLDEVEANLSGLRPSGPKPQRPN